MHHVTNTNNASTLRAALLLGIVIILTMTLWPAAASATPRRHVSWAPDINRQVVPRRTTNHGKQLATWYGPGLFGNRTACGQTLTPGTWGIAHRTLPCGTMVTLQHRGRKVSVRVIDRGPFSGATVDLTSRTKSFLRFKSGHVKMSQLRKYRVLPKHGIRSTGSFRASR